MVPDSKVPTQSQTALTYQRVRASQERRDLETELLHFIYFRSISLQKHHSAMPCHASNAIRACCIKNNNNANIGTTYLTTTTFTFDVQKAY